MGVFIFTLLSFLLMVTLHIFSDDNGNLVASHNAELVQGSVTALWVTTIDEATWEKLREDPKLENRGRLNEFLRRLIPAKTEKILTVS